MLGAAGSFKESYRGFLCGAPGIMLLGQKCDDRCVITVAVKVMKDRDGIDALVDCPSYNKFEVHYEGLKIELHTLQVTSALNDASERWKDDIIRRKKALPPFKVPKVRFVRAALAVDLPSATTVDVKTPRAYLIEEEITGEFIKFVNNDHAVPMDKLPYEARDLADYCCFLQHLQWNRTRGLMITSDYQGSMNGIFTDPQLLTHP